MRNNDMVLPALADTTKSILPSPSISPDAILLGDVGIAVLISCFVANELVEINPIEATFLNNEIVFEF